VVSLRLLTILQYELQYGLARCEILLQLEFTCLHLCTRVSYTDGKSQWCSDHRINRSVCDGRQTSSSKDRYIYSWDLASVIHRQLSVQHVICTTVCSTSVIPTTSWLCNSLRCATIRQGEKVSRNRFSHYNSGLESTNIQQLWCLDDFTPQFTNAETTLF